MSNQDEVKIEPTGADESVVAEECSAETIKKLREKLKIYQKERDEYLAGWQRAKADLINARRRDEEDKKEFVKLANERLFDDLIPALDSFDAAFGNKEVWEKIDKNWRTGVEYIHGQFVKALENHGLIQYTPAVGEKFDSVKHEPVGSLPAGRESDDHTIAEVVKKGYLLWGEVLRPAKVKIFEFKIKE